MRGIVGMQAEPGNTSRRERYEAPGERFGGGLLAHLPGEWQWDDLAMEVGQESQARVALVGLLGSGKSLLFNRLRGWNISQDGSDQDATRPVGGWLIESYGAFILADLPEQERMSLVTGEELVLSLGDPSLLVYLINGEEGVAQADYRWISVLRACGKPIIPVLNKCDLLVDVPAAVASAQQQLGAPVIPVSAATGERVEAVLLPAMLDAAPRLAVPLGREIVSLRRTAARRVIRQAALFAGIMSAQPVPLLDIPFQIMVQVGLVMRVGAAYGRTPTGGVNREIVGTVASSLGLHYLAQSLIKLVPVFGWVASGISGALATWAIGEAAILYFEGAVARGEAAFKKGAGRLAQWPRQTVLGKVGLVAQRLGKGLQRSAPGLAEAEDEYDIPIREA